MRKVLLMIGGGLFPTSTRLLESIRNTLTAEGIKVFFCFNSFEGMINPENWVECEKKSFDVIRTDTTFFGTCRDLDLTRDKSFREKAFKVLKKEGIDTIIVAGGDGSSRNLGENKKEFSSKGIKIVFVPGSIDGINGTYFPTGLDTAATYIDDILRDLLKSTTRTHQYDTNEYRVVFAIIPGRNRNDLLEAVARKDPTSLYGGGRFMMVPAGDYNCNMKALAELINNESEHVLVLMAEGAKNLLSEIKKLLRANKKTSEEIIGNKAQVAKDWFISDEERKLIEIWAYAACTLVLSNRSGEVSLDRNKNAHFHHVGYYQKRNPRNLEVVPFSFKEFSKFLAK